MGRTCIVDSKVQQYIESTTADAATNTGWNIGFIIGQLSAQKDYVIHLTTSKIVLENETEDDKPKPENLADVSELIIVHHARQVKRMLTGGLDIIGVYAVADSETLKTLQVKLKQILLGVYKALNKSEFVALCHSDRVLLQICSRTKKLTCRTFNVKDPKSSAEPCEWKYQKISDSFVNLHASFSLDSVLPVPSKSLSYTLRKQMMIGLEPVYQKIWNSLATINDRLVEDERLPVCPKPTAESGRGHGRKSLKDGDQTQDTEILDVALLQEMKVDWENIAAPVMEECGAKLLIRGTINSQAHVHVRSSAAEAIQALKRDIIQSIVTRCELLCDDLLQAEEEQDVRVLYEMPQRVCCHLPDTNIRFCDYLFQDETLDDSVDRFRVLLELNVSSKDFDCSDERLPEDYDLVRPRYCREKSLYKVAPQKQKSSPVFRYLGVATAAVAAVFSMWMAFSQMD